MAGLYTHITRASGTILTATIYNSDHQNHIDNHIPAMIDDYSVNLAQMQSQVDPGELGTENLATDLAGEIQRFRFALAELKGTTYWYESAANLALLATANEFTQPQAITNSAAALTLTLKSPAASGPMMNFNNTKNPGVANDEIGELRFSGIDSAGNAHVYAFLDAFILDPTNGSEDGQLRFITAQGGAATVVFSAALGMRVGNALSDKGVGTINAEAGLYIAGHGTVAQHLVDFDSTYTNIPTIMPADDTIPQSTEGDEVLSVTITPTNGSSRILVLATLNIGGATSAIVSGASFRGGFSNGIGASEASINTSAAMQQLQVFASYDALDTTARSYSIRMGAAAAGDAKLNGDGSARVFGGAAVSRLDVFEILPQ